MSDNQIIVDKFGRKIPISFTNSYSIFANELADHFLLLVYLLTLDKYVDKEKREDALQIIINNLLARKNIIYSNFAEYLKNEINIKLFDLNSYERVFGQMTLCRYVDNFLCYLKDVLVEVMNKQPNILRSSETEKLEDILSFDSMEELREYIVEKKLKALFYKNFDEINKFFTARLGIDILGENASNLNLLIKQRNAIVHNRAKINMEIIELDPLLHGNFNEQLIYTYNELDKISLFLNDLAMDIDAKLINKFNLTTNKNPFV
jgi:hypothetical protein